MVIPRANKVNFESEINCCDTDRDRAEPFIPELPVNENFYAIDQYLFPNEKRRRKRYAFSPAVWIMRWLIAHLPQ